MKCNYIILSMQLCNKIMFVIICQNVSSYAWLDMLRLVIIWFSLFLKILNVSNINILAFSSLVNDNSFFQIILKYEWWTS